MSINFRARPTRQGPLAQLLVLIGTVLALIAAFMFSLVFFAVVAVLGLGLWAYFWWATRALRRQLREQLAAAQAGAKNPRYAAPGAASAAASADAGEGGTVIDGEAVRVVDEGRRIEP